MLSRRMVLMGAAAAGAAALARPFDMAWAAASQPSTPVNFEVPSGAVDCHTHIFGDPQVFPWAQVRVYTPELASVVEMRSLHKTLHVSRVVIVNPSIYGTDNSCTMDAMRNMGFSSRGIAVIDAKPTGQAFEEMNRTGMRGIRINLETGGQSNEAQARQRFQAAVNQIKGTNWHIQMYTRPSVIEAIAEQVMAAPMPVVFDHFGGAQGALGTQQPGFAALLNLVKSGKAYVKLSAPYRGSTQAPDYPDMTPLAKALIAANPERILWGSDWPHMKQIPGRKFTEVTPLYQIDDGRVLNLLPVWAPSAALRKTILVENPARLFGY